MVWFAPNAERKIIAKIEEKNKARQQYETAKSEGKRTSLLEQQRPNVFQMNVANIMPGDVIKVSLKYTEMIIPEEGTYEFVYPTVVGPRYKEAASANDQYVNTPYLKNGSKSPYAFDISVNLSTGVPIQHLASETHQIKVKYPDVNSAEIKLDATEKSGGNKDFVLSYKLAGDKIESGLMLYEHNDENFFMLMVQPPKRIIKEDIPPREYIFIVDVSGSMDQATKDIAKRFYVLLYLFLTRTYENVEVVFIRHHTQAKEVDEHEFFYSQETGGTIVSSALKLMNEIVQDRYPVGQWNIYAAQASDGDNWADDSPRCRELLVNKLLPNCQYYSYIEITRRSHQTLWHEYEKLAEAFPNFAMKNIRSVEDIFPVFRELFQKETA